MSDIPPTDSTLGVPPVPPAPEESAPKSASRRMPILLSGLLALSVAGVAVLGFLFVSASGDRDDVEVERDELASELASARDDLGQATNDVAALGADLEAADAAAVDLQAEIDAAVPVAEELEDLHASARTFLIATFVADPTLNRSDANCVADGLLALSGSAAVLRQYADVMTAESERALVAFGLDVADAAEDCGVDLEAGLEGDNYGDNPELDLLWDQCEAGAAFACDQLYNLSSFGSGYELFGGTCGGRYADLRSSPAACFGNM